MDEETLEKTLETLMENQLNLLNTIIRVEKRLEECNEELKRYIVVWGS